MEDSLELRHHFPKMLVDSSVFQNLLVLWWQANYYLHETPVSRYIFLPPYFQLFKPRF
jgi:hypothetical protein